MPLLERFKIQAVSKTHIKLPMHKLAERMACIFPHELQDMETLVFQLLQHFSQVWNCYMYWTQPTENRLSRRSLISPYHTSIWNLSSLLAGSRASSVQKPTGSIANCFKNPSTYARLSILWNSNFLVSCQTLHGHYNFPWSMWFLGKHLKIRQA